MLYWITTVLISAYLLLSAGTYLFSEATIAGVRDLGFPDFFRIQLAVLKITAAIVLLAPTTNLMIKDWAYAGTGLFIITAIVAHQAHKDPIWLNLINLVLFALLIVSRYSLPSILK